MTKPRKRTLSPWVGGAAMLAWFCGALEVSKWLAAGMSESRQLVVAVPFWAFVLAGLFGLARWTERLRAERAKDNQRTD